MVGKVQQLMQSLPWAGLAGSAVTVLIPAHGDSWMPDGTNDIVFWALPVAKFVFNVSGAAVTGALVLALVALTPGSREHARALNFAGASAVVWTLAAIATGFMDYLEKSGESVTFTESFARQLGHFFTAVGLGQKWLATVVIVSLIPLLCVGARSLVVTAAAAMLALAGWVPLALIGHPNYGEGHEAGILAFALHILAAATWLGGLITLVVLRPALDGERLAAVVGRYSTLALVAFLVLVFSGFLRAQVTVGTVDNLRSSFGNLVAVKIAAILVLGVVGFVQRRWILSRMGRDPSGRSSWFWPLVAIEVLVMVLASGAAVTLLRLDEPIPDDPVVDYRVLAEKMADEPLPPPPGPVTFLTETAFDPLWTVLVVAGVVCYVTGVRRLRRQGEGWPWGRTMAWWTGMAALFYLTNGGVNQYQNFLLSAQVLLQMALVAVVPLLLVLGRPVALALLAVHPREDGSKGVREWLEAVAGSWAFRVLVHPYVAAGLVMASVLAYYNTSLLEWSARELLGHQWMAFHFLAVGALLGTAVLGAPGSGAHVPRRARTALPALALFYVIFGTVLLVGTPPLSPDWYAAMERPWGIDPLIDQALGGWYVVGLGLAQTAGLAAGAFARRRRAPGDHGPSLAPAAPAARAARRRDGEPPSRPLLEQPAFDRAAWPSPQAEPPAGAPR